MASKWYTGKPVLVVKTVDQITGSTIATMHMWPVDLYGRVKALLILRRLSNWFYGGGGGTHLITLVHSVVPR